MEGVAAAAQGNRKREHEDVYSADESTQTASPQLFVHTPYPCPPHQTAAGYEFMNTDARNDLSSGAFSHYHSHQSPTYPLNGSYAFGTVVPPPPPYQRTTPCVEELQQQLDILRESYDELQRLYGQRCGEVVMLQKTLAVYGTNFVGHAGVGLAATSTTRRSPSPSPWYCPTCGLSVTSEATLRAHFNGERHRKNLMRRMSSGTLPEVVPKSSSDAQNSD